MNIKPIFRIFWNVIDDPVPSILLLTPIIHTILYILYILYIGILSGIETQSTLLYDMEAWTVFFFMFESWIPGTQHYVLRNPPIATSDPELPIMA